MIFCIVAILKKNKINKYYDQLFTIHFIVEVFVQHSIVLQGLCLTIVSLISLCYTAGSELHYKGNQEVYILALLTQSLVQQMIYMSMKICVY